MFKQTDIDIDVANRDLVLSKVPHIKAMMCNNGIENDHHTGVYFQKIPSNPITNRATIDYKESASHGYFKIDFLNVSIYERVHNETHLVKLMTKEPEWDMLMDSDILSMIFHIGSYKKLIHSMKPRSIKELAMLLAIIRPSKSYLQNKPWDVVEKEVWIKPENDEYYFKKAHSFSYAAAIVVQMNLISEGEIW